MRKCEILVTAWLVSPEKVSSGSYSSLESQLVLSQPSPLFDFQGCISLLLHLQPPRDTWCDAFLYCMSPWGSVICEVEEFDISEQSQLLNLLSELFKVLLLTLTAIPNTSACSILPGLAQPILTSNLKSWI